MSAIASQPIDTRSSLLRSVVIGWIFIAVAQTVVQQFLFYSVIQQIPFISVLQYVASGVTGMSAFEGGTTTALIGLLIHVAISFVVAAVFIVAADRIPFLRRNAIAVALLYGVGVWAILNLIVTPLSAAPPQPAPTMPELIEAIVEHALVIGLPLGIIVRRSASRTQ